MNAPPEGDAEYLASVRSLEAPPGEGERPPRFTLLSIEEVEKIPPPTFLVEDIIPDASACEIHGPPGGGKTFLTIDLALCVASGASFFGHKVRQGNVVYVIGEGQSGMGARIRAWKAARAMFGEILFSVVANPVQLLEPPDVELFVRAIEAGLAEKPLLIVLDTLARCFLGGEENSARDMGMAVATVDALRRRTGAAILLVHHTRVDGDRERGSIALRGGMDTMLSLSGDEERMTLSCEKQKDAPPFGDLKLHLVESLDSMVFSLPGVSSAGGPSRKAMAALEVLIRDFPETSPSTSEWKEAAEAPKSSFYRATGELLRAGYVTVKEKGAGKKWTATPDGRMAAALIGKNLETNGKNGSESQQSQTSLKIFSTVESGSSAGVGPPSVGGGPPPKPRGAESQESLGVPTVPSQSQEMRAFSRDTELELHTHIEERRAIQFEANADFAGEEDGE